MKANNSNRNRNNKELEPGESPTGNKANPENPGKQGQEMEWLDIFADQTQSRAHRPAESDPLTGPRTSIKDVHAKASTRRSSAVIGAMGASGCFAACPDL
ncbi:hypothetical protein V491_08619 [Pseudogymnoascus sp. VKM F-3775]|nr:hypothetical protein V491_08619 [Pseudogymnoascus sp. VKM F-3775]